MNIAMSNPMNVAVAFSTSMLADSCCAQGGQRTMEAVSVCSVLDHQQDSPHTWVLCAEQLGKWVCLCGARPLVMTSHFLSHSSRTTAAVKTMWWPTLWRTQMQPTPALHCWGCPTTSSRARPMWVVVAMATTGIGCTVSANTACHVIQVCRGLEPSALIVLMHLLMLVQLTCSEYWSWMDSRVWMCAIFIVVDKLIHSVL